VRASEQASERQHPFVLRKSTVKSGDRKRSSTSFELFGFYKCPEGVQYGILYLETAEQTDLARGTSTGGLSYSYDDCDSQLSSYSRYYSSYDRVRMYPYVYDIIDSTSESNASF